MQVAKRFSEFPRNVHLLVIMFHNDTAPEQMLHPSQSVRCIEGVDEVLGHVFELAGFRTVQQLRSFDRQDQQLLVALDRVKEERERANLPPMQKSYYRRLRTMCLNVVIRLRNGQDADEVVPEQFRCPITHDWLEDPVSTVNGHTYERDAIQEWLDSNPGRDPFRAAEHLTMDDLSTNTALLEAVRYFRAHHRKFTITC
jgi:hypothetical protein